MYQLSESRKQVEEGGLEAISLDKQESGWRGESCLLYNVQFFHPLRFQQARASHKAYQGSSQDCSPNPKSNSDLVCLYISSETDGESYGNLDATVHLFFPCKITINRNVETRLPPLGGVINVYLKRNPTSSQPTELQAPPQVPPNLEAIRSGF